MLCLLNMSKEDAAHRLERQPKGLYVSTFCIMQQSILVAATGNLVYQMWAVKRRGLVRFSGNMTLSITSTLHNLSCEELFLEYSVYDLLFTGVNVKSTPTETSLWRGAAGTAYTHVFLTNCTSAMLSWSSVLWWLMMLLKFHRRQIHF